MLAVNVDAKAVMLVVAHSSDIQLPHSSTNSRSGIIYCAEGSGNINVIDAQRRPWLCLMAERPVEHPVDIVPSMRI